MERGYMAGSREVGDYRLTSIVIGWEVSGIFDVEMEMRNLSVKALTGVAQKQR